MPPLNPATPTAEVSAPAPLPVKRVPRWRSIVARLLVVLGIVFLVISLLSNFVKREALDKDNFRTTAEQLIANDNVRNQIAAQMVETLYANVDVSNQLQDQLPNNLQSLAGPIAGISRGVADRGAQEVLSRPRVQKIFVGAASAAQQTLVKVLENNSQVVDTTDGNVVLNIRDLVLQLGDQFQIVNNLDKRLPADAGQITILKSDQLDTAQNITQ